MCFNQVNTCHARGTWRTVRFSGLLWVPEITQEHTYEQERRLVLPP